MDLLKIEKQLQQKVIVALKSQPPISIELYPLEIYALARGCFFALITAPKNKVALHIMKKLKAILTNHYPQLKVTLDKLLNTEN